MEISDREAYEYLQRRGDGCPSCGSSNTEGGSYDLDTGTIYQPMHCTACGLDWTDCYELDRILEVEGVEYTVVIN